MRKYKVESIEETNTAWGVFYVANVRLLNDTTLYRLGPVYSVQELAQRLLDRFGK